MVSVLSGSHAMYFTLVLIMFSNFAVSKSLKLPHNSTHSMSSWNGRPKRSPFDELPSELRLRVRYESGEKVDLTFRKTSQFLANEYLPIITSYTASNPNVMGEIGQFVLYHDEAKCSAVVYFDKFKTLYGVIGMNHYIQDLPFEFDENGAYQSIIASAPYIKQHAHPFYHINPSLVYPPPSDTDAWYDFLRPSMHNPHEISIFPSTSESEPPSKRHRTNQDYEGRHEQETSAQNQVNAVNKHRQCRLNYKQYFLETLVFVTRDIAETFEGYFGKDQYLEWIVRYLIIYFNAVDMVIQKARLPHMSIHINIAKIVIENEFTPFTFITDNEFLQFVDVVDKLPDYLKSHADRYTPDSFDHVFIYTSRPIFIDNVQVEGSTKHGLEMYLARKNNLAYNAVPVTMIRFQTHYADYTVAVHEISRIFGTKIERREKGLKPIGQCTGIMQREGAKCDDCLKWTDDNRMQIENFLSHNTNRCFFLNKPRSLWPSGVSSFVSASVQCQCFGFLSTTITSGRRKKSVGNNGCAKTLQCQKSNKLGDHEPTILPFDGTPCSINKSCWEGKCLPVTVETK